MRWSASGRARALGGAVKPGVALFYALALALWAGAVWRVRPDWVALIALLPVAAHLIWQVATLRPADPQDPLVKFRSNRNAGLLAFLAFAAVGLAG